MHERKRFAVNVKKSGRKLCAMLLLAAASSAVFAAPKIEDLIKQAQQMKKELKKNKGTSATFAEMERMEKLPKMSREMLDAIHMNNVAEVKRLLQEGENPNAVNAFDMTYMPVLSKAVINGNAEIVKALLDAGADAHVTHIESRPVNLLHDAVNRSSSSVKLVKLLLAEGLDVNAVTKTNLGRETNSVLMSACGSDSPETVEIVRLLVESGANVNYKNDDGLTVLASAIKPDRPERTLTLVKYLVGAGAKVNDGCSFGFCVKAASLNAVTAFLIDSGANVNKVPYLITAAEAENLGAVKLLITAGANVNAKNGRGSTALHAVPSKGCNTVSWAGDARYDTLTEIARFLIKSGADVNARNKDGETPLMIAAGFGGGAICEVLLSSGAEVNARDNAGRTALWYTENAHFSEVVDNSGATKVLKKYGAIY